MKPCIFLDVDGVLNSEAAFIRAHKEAHLSPSSDLVDPDMLDNFVLLWRALGKPDIVLSSTWRLIPTAKRLIASILWARAGIPILDCTPDIRIMQRGLEVKTWLTDNGERKHIILDDDNDFEEDQLLILTTFKDGLTMEKVREATELWNKE